MRRIRLSRLRSATLSLLQAHPLLSFLLMGLCFLGFGVSSFNLAILLRANLELFWDYGWQVVQDGALEQLLQLLALSYAALAAWVGFKCCEKLLVDRLTRPPERE
ncbi:hypothetical protein FNU76_01295 [Chitinimonas arctica]|uniref:Uncharacterized protein n=1 Tax=Chitinimonas arctica TaxID=2594795 RepID=A0A516SAC3_9NEIS|nr:hypothetical protein [Chitinimonas arctica]QDQ25096.1 hypothetical protein FNU76_01295 [Chitinimonas arctica]